MGGVTSEDLRHAGRAVLAILSSARARRFLRVLVAIAVSSALSAAIVMHVKIPSEGLGEELRKAWEGIRGGGTLEAPRTVFEGVLSLSLFFLLIASMMIDMRYRHFTAFLAVSIVAFLGVVPPQKLVESVDWSLIVFLIGSMSFATVLRRLGVFTHLAAYMIRLSRGSTLALLGLLSLLAWFTAMVVDEVTSIVYITMIALELCRLLRIEPEDMVLLVVLATNTGSLALPVGNPIGVYIAFTANFTVREFLRTALPLSLMCYVSALATYVALNSRYVNRLGLAIQANSERLEAFITTRVVDISQEERLARVYGIALLLSFLVTVAASTVVADLIHLASGTYVEPNSLLAVIPYLYLVLTLPVGDAAKLGDVIARGVEWPSLTFFMLLFMLGFSLTWSGAMVRVAYAMVSASRVFGSGIYPMFSVLMVFSAALSAFLDNLSLVVALTPAVGLLAKVLGLRELYWAVLFGAVLGGNLTPIGSTANIVAVSMLEKRRIRISWGRWARVAVPVFLGHCALALAWSYFFLR